MDDSIHTQVYQRFFASLLSVLPGVILTLGVGSFVLWLLADAIGIEWGWGVGIAAVVLSLVFVGWIFIGLGIQKWAADKPAGMLFGLNAPFLLIAAAFMLWLFYVSVINANQPGSHDDEPATESAEVVRITPASLG